MYNQKSTMTVRYEINPPKVSDDGQNARNILFERIKMIGSVCNGIHLTDSVLGIPRVSPFEIAKKIRESNKDMKITCSLRVRDRNLNEIKKIVEESTGIVDGILVLMGDKSDKLSNKEELIPSQVVKALNEDGFGKKTELFLSIPSNPNFAKIQKKIDANPTGFFTQVVHSKDQIEKISNQLDSNGFKIIPCLLLPSHKNLKSAEFLKIDWSDYKENIVGFINEIHGITDDILITSPNDFKRAYETISKLAI
jgi:homocysteine S-methyltransferase|tara:strand:- start:1419 stop:2174 length:756 start_codon:yes stop_codon:yes gene_type:complete